LGVLPLNLVADFGGGALYLATGMLAAMLEAAKSGQGQVVDAAMIDGVASMSTLFQGLLAAGMWQEKRGANLLDGSAPFYRTYATKDGKAVVVGAIERQFFKTLLEVLEIESIDPADQFDIKKWPEHIKIFESRFLSESRDYWCNLLEGTDACFAPVLDMPEAFEHPHNKARNTFVKIDGITQSAPAPRFSRTESEIGRSALCIFGMCNFLSSKPSPSLTYAYLIHIFDQCGLNGTPLKRSRTWRSMGSVFRTQKRSSMTSSRSRFPMWDRFRKIAL
jgi:alpha-methylacyl-CoA racemase